jgi:hypothetical protein
MDKVESILNLNLPKDNYYPIGPALLVTPFSFFTNVSVVSTFFWANIGFIFYFLIAQIIKNRLWNYVILFSFFINVYLFWNFKSSQDTVFEFAFLLISVYLLIKQKYTFALISLFFLSNIRSGYGLLFVITFIILLFKRSILGYKFQKMLLPLFLFILGILINLMNYGTLTPSNTSGQTIYFGQNKYFYLGHPNFDIDVFLAEEGHMIPNGYSQESLWNRNLTSVDQIYLEEALAEIKKNPQALIQNTISKIDNIFFNLQKVPNLPGKHWLSKDAKVIYIEQQALTLKYALGNLIYFFYRCIAVVLLIYSLSILFFNRKTAPKRQFIAPFWLLLPFVSWIPINIIYYEDTRFRIVPEILFVPAAVMIISKFKIPQANNAK